MHEARIRCMQEAGILDQRQAERLLASLGPTTTAADRRRKLRWPLALTAVIVMLLFMVLLWFTGAGEDELPQQVAATLNHPDGVTNMNKTLSTVLAVAILLILPLLIWVWLHNSLVAKEEQVLASWAQVESSYQRRADLIPGLVETVSRYLQHEQDTLAAVTEQRSQGLNPLLTEKLIEAQYRAAKLLREHGGRPPEEDAELTELAQAQSTLGKHMRQFLGLVENYPQLRSADQFLELQAQLEGTENRINVARQRFNETVRDYNGATRKLPTSLIASVGGFRRKAYFQAEEGAAQAPELNFQ